MEQIQVLPVKAAIELPRRYLVFINRDKVRAALPASGRRPCVWVAVGIKDSIEDAWFPSQIQLPPPWSTVILTTATQTRVTLRRHFQADTWSPKEFCSS